MARSKLKASHLNVEDIDKTPQNCSHSLSVNCPTSCSCRIRFSC